jgi:hypothetical protein
MLWRHPYQHAHAAAHRFVAVEIHPESIDANNGRHALPLVTPKTLDSRSACGRAGGPWFPPFCPILRRVRISVSLDDP